MKQKALEFIEPKVERKDLFDKDINERIRPGSYEIKDDNTKAGIQKFFTLQRKI